MKRILPVMFMMLFSAFSGFAADYMVVNQLLGPAEIKTGTGPYQPIRGTGFRLEKGMTVRTGEGGFLQLAFSSDSSTTVVLRGAATMEITELLSHSRNGLYLHTGRLTAVVSAIMGDKFNLRTSTAVLGIRGTEFTVHARGSKSTDIFVVKGEVEVVSVLTDTRMVLHGGESASVSHTGIEQTDGVSSDTGLKE